MENNLKIELFENDGVTINIGISLTKFPRPQIQNGHGHCCVFKFLGRGVDGKTFDGVFRVKATFSESSGVPSSVAGDVSTSAADRAGWRQEC